MTSLLDVVSIVAIVAGAIFFLAGTLGLLRFPDTFTRLHALTKADNLGLGLVVLGLLPQVDGVVDRAEARGRVAARDAGRRVRVADGRARGAPRASAVTDVLNVGLAALIVGAGDLGGVRARRVRRGRRLHRVRAAAHAGLGAAARRRRGADGSRHRRRPDRRAADRRGIAPARHRGRRARRTAARAARASRPPRSPRR